MSRIEEWRDIEGYEGAYQVSNLGNIYSFKTKRKINPYTDRAGYKIVKLFTNNKIKRFKVHRLVAKAFLENPDNLPFVNHIDANKINNNVKNLEFCTPKQNSQHASRLGLNLKGTSNTNCKFDNIKLLTAYTLIGVKSDKELADYLGVIPRSFLRYKNGDRHKMLYEIYKSLTK